jgi:F-type H+-transporting ATPase subunit b
VLTLFAAESTEVNNPILPVFPEIFWGALTFALFYVLMRYVLLPPVLRTMEDRDHALRDDWDAAKAAQAKAANADAELAEALAPARAQAAALIETARTQAEAERAEIVGAAQGEIEAMRQLANAEIDAARMEAMGGVDTQVADLTAQAASRLMNRPIDAASAQGVVNRIMSERN